MKNRILIGGLAIVAAWGCNGRVDAGPGDGGALAQRDAEATPPSATDATPQSATEASPDSSLAESSIDQVDEGGSGQADTSAANGSDAACYATCSTPAGTVQLFASVADVYAALEGRWQICGSGAASTFPDLPADVIGVEYGPATVEAPDSSCGGFTGTGPTCGGGDMYYLVQSSSGPVRGTGFAYQLTYDVTPNGNYFQLNMHPMPNSGFGGSFEYSPCPTEFLISGDPGNATLVPLY
jgi:hypothetical protein